MQIKVKLFYFLLKDLEETNLQEVGKLNEGFNTPSDVRENRDSFHGQLWLLLPPLHTCTVHVKSLRECKS